MSSSELSEQGYVLTDRIVECLNTPQVEQRSAEWFKLRTTRITGSVCDTIVGNNPYQTYDRLVAEKAGMPVEFKGNEATRHGTYYEPIATKLYEETVGRKVVELGLVPHPTIDILAHSPDGISLSTSDLPVLLEVKCPFKRKIEDKVPKYYVGQLQLGMFIFDVKQTHFVQYRPEPFEFQITIVDRDEGWLDKNMPLFRKFWSDVEAWKERGWRTHPLAQNAAQKYEVDNTCML